MGLEKGDEGQSLKRGIIKVLLLTLYSINTHFEASTTDSF